MTTQEMNNADKQLAKKDVNSDLKKANKGIKLFSMLIGILCLASVGICGYLTWQTFVLNDITIISIMFACCAICLNIIMVVDDKSKTSKQKKTFLFKQFILLVIGLSILLSIYLYIL